MTIRKLLKNTLLVLISALAFSCANPGRPDGGAYDETPPSVVGTSPKEYALNNKQQKITLLFSEYIKLDNAAEKVVIRLRSLTNPKYARRERKSMWS